MTDARTLQPGPWRKSPAWRGGAFLLGIAALLIIVDWLLGSFLDIGIERILLTLVVAGVALSAPYGLGIGRRAPERRPVPELIPQARVQQGEAGSTYVIVGSVDPPAPPAAAPGGPHTRRELELTAGWYALYAVFWRLPVTMGDYALTGLWRLVAHVRGTRHERPARDLNFDSPDSLPRPDRDTF